MKAMILAAGLGTRLRPLTLERPKALVPVGNVPLIERSVAYLGRFGVDRIAVNAHHLSEQILSHFQEKRRDGVTVKVYEEPEILGTGGGLKNTEDFWDEAPFLLMNGDVFTDMDLNPAVKVHCREGHLATLLVHDCTPYNQILVGPGNRILDISPTQGPGRLAFTGIHVLSPRILEEIPSRGFSSIVDVYRDLIRRGIELHAHPSNGGTWRDIGTVGSYLLANKDCAGKERFLVGEGSKIHESALLAEWAVLGKGVEVGAHARVVRSVLWDGVRVLPAARHSDCVITSQGRVACTNGA